MKYTFTLELDVYDEDALRAAARAHPDAKYSCPEELESPADCIQILLDPGTLPGCSIEESRCD